MKTILVIEDETAVRDSIQELLECEDFHVLSVADGASGLQLAAAYHPDLILCDVKMPQMDGYAVLKALQANPTTRTIPLIFLTGYGTPADVRHGMDLGADDYLIKPCATDNLLRAIAKRLEKQATLHAQTTEQLDHLRSSLALSLPHELRTPLAGILTSVQLLRLLASDQPQLVNIANTIQTSTERLHQLVRNFLLYAELEIASRDPNPSRQTWRSPLYDADVIIKSTVHHIAQAANREADLELEIYNSIVNFDGPNLQKIIQEIASNAFKFSEPGTTVRVCSFMDDRVYVVSVTDHGRGMTAEQIASLGAYVQFERQFYEQQGFGLGLTIAKRLLELNGGSLLIESQPKQQTTVRATFPIAPSQP